MAYFPPTPTPQNKTEVRKLLGLLGYCRLWIEGYTQVIRFLYDKLIEESPTLTKEDKASLEQLKTKLTQVPVLNLPSLDNPFYLYVNVEGGVAHGVLAQDWGGIKKPVAFLSKMLDPISRGWPICIQAVAATSILVEESRKLTFGGKLMVHTLHSVRNILNQKAEKWLTDSRMLKYEAILLNQEDLTLVTSKILNPAQFLYGEPKEELIHDCMELINYQTRVREDLADYAHPEEIKYT